MEDNRNVLDVSPSLWKDMSWIMILDRQIKKYLRLCPIDSLCLCFHLGPRQVQLWSCSLIVLAKNILMKGRNWKIKTLARARGQTWQFFRFEKSITVYNSNILWNVNTHTSSAYKYPYTVSGQPGWAVCVCVCVWLDRATLQWCLCWPYI